MKPTWSAVALVCLVFPGSAGIARAQNQTRAMIVGTIRDGGGAALDGATVRLRHVGGSGEPLTTITTVGGTYRFFGLLPGVYELSATRPGLAMASRPNIRVTGGATLTIDVVVAKAGTPAADTVNGGPIVDVTATGSVTRLSTGDLENLPIVGTAILQLVPGVTARTALGSGLDTSEIVVDGSPINMSSRTNALARIAGIHIYWMEDATIAAGGVGAGTGESSGVVASVALRSGNNAFAGLFEQRFTPPGLVGDNSGGLSESAATRIVSEEIVSRWDSSIQVGGPLTRDRLFFFAGFHYDRNRVVQAGTIGNQPFDERAPAWLAKLTWAPAPALRVGGFVEANRARAVGRVSLNATPDTANDQTAIVRTWGGHVDWNLGLVSVMRAYAGGLSSDFRGIPEERRASPPSHQNRSQTRSGNVSQFQDVLGRRDRAGFILTRWLDRGSGRGHVLEAGFEIERTFRRQVTGWPGGEQTREDANLRFFRDLWQGERTSATGWRTTVFVEDSWSAPGRLTIRPGLRRSANRGSVPDNGTVFRTAPWSPRLGVAWDVTTDHRTVVRAAYDRLPEGLYPGLFSFMNTTGTTPLIKGEVIGGVFHEIERTVPGRVDIADDLRHARVDQYSTGIERELFTDFSASIQFIRRDFKEIWGFIDTGTQFAQVRGIDPGPDGRVGTDDDAPVTVAQLLNPNESFAVLTNPDTAYRRYDAAQVIAQKRYSNNWQLLAAYTWSRTRGNVNPGLGENQADGTDTGAGASGVFFDPNRQVNADGPASFDYRHQLTVQGVYRLPVGGGIGVSAGFSYLSGGAWGRTASITPVSQTPPVMRTEPRGTRRIAAAGALDVRIEKTLRLAACRCSVGIYSDLFNATNEGVPQALTVVEQSGARLGDPMSWAAPRTVRFAVRLKF